MEHGSIALATLASPPVLFFVLGLAAAFIRSDLKFPEAFAKGLSLFLIMAIGFKGGAEMARASLDAACKYPWPLALGVDDPGGRRKFGVYADDVAAFEWMREGAPDRVPSIEAQVMDLSDDIAYSVHDFEDAIVGGVVDAGILASRDHHEDLVRGVLRWMGDELTEDEVRAAFERLQRIETWVTEWSGTRANLARLKNLTSRLIGRFAHEAVHATRAAHPQSSLARYSAAVVVPVETRAEIGVLKGAVGTLVMAHDERQPLYAHQRRLLTDLADAVWAAGPQALRRVFRADFEEAADDTARRRVVPAGHWMRRTSRWRRRRRGRIRSFPSGHP